MLGELAQKHEKQMVALALFRKMQKMIWMSNASFIRVPNCWNCEELNRNWADRRTTCRHIKFNSKPTNWKKRRWISTNWPTIRRARSISTNWSQNRKTRPRRQRCASDCRSNNVREIDLMNRQNYVKSMKTSSRRQNSSKTNNWSVWTKL